MSMDNTKGRDVKIDCSKDGRVKQSFAKSVNVNSIVEKYRKTGLLDHVQRVQPAFADVTGLTDFRVVQNRIVKAREAFESLPAKIRSRFHNQAHELIEFMQNPENEGEAVALGLLQKKEPAKPAPVKDPKDPKDPKDLVVDVDPEADPAARAA